MPFLPWSLRGAVLIFFLQLLVLPLTAQPDEGMASYYADRFHDRLTSTGESYDKEDYTAASKAYPYGTVLEVTNVTSGSSVEVRVNDCGPHHPNRIIDLSRAAARSIGLLRTGTARVQVKVVELGDQGPTCHRGAWTRAEKRKRTRTENRDRPALAATEAQAPVTTITEVRPDTVPAPAAPETNKPAPQRKKEFAPDEMLFGVQVGAFSQEKNASELVSDLQTKGFSDAWFARVGKVYRVFTGRFYFQDEARDLRDRVREAGYGDATVRRVQ
ncbi:septal ring lytic transglycosylase RlpA family protein [Neolewinella litorea]|uniref:Probable endolytic peptidoglycan transglycosylase RlpA n=1 Tax=Neolewinella litorea TaxID=2562452 RepID=A0A4S4NFU7_9BACT|nr:septal ring lytic transglycosylase RlpA family protein [Neolewinella litorea]THH37685.1 SPOR domain-containing protein [Neolewinella litorea]